MRSWMGSMKELGSVLIIVHERIVSPAGAFHDSHRPAKAKGSSDLRKMNMGIFPLSSFCHSKNPLANMRQRLFRYGVRKDGFAAKVSDLALTILYAILVSLAQ